MYVVELVLNQYHSLTIIFIHLVNTIKVSSILYFYLCILVCMFILYICSNLKVFSSAPIIHIHIYVHIHVCMYVYNYRLLVKLLCYERTANNMGFAAFDK